MKTYGQIAYENYKLALPLECSGMLTVWDNLHPWQQTMWDAGAAAVIAEYEQRRDDQAATVQANAAERIAVLEAELRAIKGVRRKAREGAASIAPRPLASMCAEERAAVYTPPNYDEQYHEAMEKLDSIERGENATTPGGEPRGDKDFVHAAHEILAKPRYLCTKCRSGVPSILHQEYNGCPYMAVIIDKAMDELKVEDKPPWE